MSIWGNSTPLPLPINFTPGTDVNCPSGSNTSVALSSALISPAGMHVWPWCQFNAVFTLGATAPSAILITVNITGVSTVGTISVNTGLLVNNGVFQFNGYIFGTQTRSTFAGAGAGITFIVSPTAQACTFSAAGSLLLAGLGGFTES